MNTVMKTKFKVGDRVSLVCRDNVFGVGIVTVVKKNTFWVQQVSGETRGWYGGDAHFDATGREIGADRYPYPIQVRKET